MVPQGYTIINSQSNHNISLGKSTAKWTKGGSCISGKQNINVNSLESFRKFSIDLGLSNSATSPVLEDQVQTQITTCPGENGLADVLEKKFIQSSVL